jgi:hypothetical protein
MIDSVASVVPRCRATDRDPGRQQGVKTVRIASIVAVTLLGALACADTPAPPPPPPPPPKAAPPATPAAPTPAPRTTGQDFAPKGPKLPSTDDSLKVMVAVLAEAKKPAPNCALIANPKTRFAWIALPLPPKELLLREQDAFVGFARCAEKQRYYALQKDVALALLKAGAGHAELLVRAHIGLHELKGATDDMALARKRFPKDANVVVTAAKLDCLLDNWKPCADDAALSIKLAASLPSAEKLAVENRAYKYAARAALHTGQLAKAKQDAARSDRDGGNKDELAEVQALITQAELSQALVEPDYDAELPTGIYHLYNKIPKAGPLLKLLVTNLSTKDAEFKAEVSIDGVTQRAVQTVVVGKDQSKRLEFTPPFATEFNAGQLRATRSAQISVRLTAMTTGKVIYEQTLPITLEPPDFLPTIAYDGADASHTTMWFYGAWITPNAKAIDVFLRKAKARVKSTAFDGEQSDTYVQVKAIFDELQAEGMSYVMDPEVLANDAFGQRTRLPSEVLTTTNAQCLEGALLYATLFEAIGLRPVVVRVPGHAFVGWFPSPHDAFKSKLPLGVYFLETTATHDATFDQAVGLAMSEFADWNKKKQATLVDVAALRKAGVTPQPVD